MDLRNADCKAVRRQFGYTDAVTSAVAQGQFIKASQLSVRSMNFGQHWRTPGLPDIRYSIELPLAFVAHVLKRELPIYVADCVQFPDDGPLEAGLRRRGWPQAEQVLDDLELRVPALQWIAHVCLFEWLGDGEPEVSPGYVVNTIDLWEREGDQIRFGGTARRAGQQVQYQDV